MDKTACKMCVLMVLVIDDTSMRTLKIKDTFKNSLEATPLSHTSWMIFLLFSFVSNFDSNNTINQTIKQRKPLLGHTAFLSEQCYHYLDCQELVLAAGQHNCCFAPDEICR